MPDRVSRKVIVSGSKYCYRQMVWTYSERPACPHDMPFCTADMRDATGQALQAQAAGCAVRVTICLPPSTPHSRKLAVSKLAS